MAAGTWQRHRQRQQDEADCIKAEDGSVTCDTKVVNPASDTKARPYYTPFND